MPSDLTKTFLTGYNRDAAAPYTHRYEAGLQAVHDAAIRDLRLPAGTITIPRPHVPFGPTHVSPEAADADYLRAAVRGIHHLNHGERIWGHNLTATVVKLLLDSATAVEKCSPSTEGSKS